MTDLELRDAETYVTGQTILGGPVDLPDEKRTVHATVINRGELPYTPIVPGWLRNPTQRREVAAWALAYVRHAVGLHAWHSPKYAAKVAVFAPWGLLRLLGRQIRWAWLLEQHGLRQNAATKNDAEQWLKLHNHARNVRAWRMSVLVAELVAVIVGLVLLLTLTPWWAHYLAAIAALLLFAQVGRPVGKPIVDRVVIGQAFTKLTAEQVRAAVVALGMGRVKEPGDISFPPPGIRTDGPGWLARFNLPAGVEAIKVIEARGALSSALRLPLDQVWPSVGPDHEGQVDLWVGRVPTSKMPPPKWALTSEHARVSVFAGYPIGHDERLRPVKFTPFEKNLLIGGQPGAGKSVAGRSVVLGALLDPLVEMQLAAFKAAEDFYDVSGFCSRYVCGVDQGALDAGAEMMAGGLREVQRRQAILGKLKREEKIVEGRVTLELAAAGLGLHPLFLVFDEAHELLCDDDVARDAIRLVKQGRSAFVHCVFITQVASAGAVPPELTRVTSSRWCLSVADQIANDQIMGTGAYKRGLSGTVYRPKVDAGWGASMGIQDGYQGAIRAYYPGQQDLAAMLKRIKQLRAGTAFTAFDVDHTPRRDVLADVLHVFATAGRPALHREPLAERLAQLAPEAYSGLSADALAAVLRDQGVTTTQVKVDGVNLAGYRREAIEAAIRRREITAGE